jgi:hypothetical protein
MLLLAKIAFDMQKMLFEQQMSCTYMVTNIG